MFWLKELSEHLADRVARGTVTHAVMLAGPPGIGKRVVAAGLAAAFLDLDGDASDLDALVAPDLHRVLPEEDKVQISVEQVRELTADLALSAHGSTKLAIIEPADMMTTAAANSLLKTLEEPTDNSLLVLINDGIGRLPATISSRTTIYRLRPPAADAATAWLVERGVAADDAAEALELADGAPLRALALATGDGLEIARRVATDVRDLLGGDNWPMAVAARWRKLPHDAVLAALRRVTIDLLRARMAPKLRSASEFGRYVVDTRDAFCYLDALNRLIARLPGSYNPELAIEAMALPWAARLAGIRDRPPAV